MSTGIERDAARHATLILGGLLLAIDPASGGTSYPGFALFHKGQLQSSGRVAIDGGQVQDRLYQLMTTLLRGQQPDVLAIERIRGANAHPYLFWSVGVTVAATRPLVVIEVPVSTWKKHVGKDHVKGDEADAVAIGQTLVALAHKRAA